MGGIATNIARGIAVLWLAAIASMGMAQDAEFGAVLPEPAGFEHPVGIATGPSTAGLRVFVADAAAHRIFYADMDAPVGPGRWRDFGYVANRNAPNALNAPQAVTVDEEGHVYALDTHDGLVRRYAYDDGSDSYTLDSGFAPGTFADNLPILLPRDLEVHPDGFVFLLDSGNGRILFTDGTGGSSGTQWQVWREDPDWSNPYGMALDSDDTILLADTGNHRILRITEDPSDDLIIGGPGTLQGQFSAPRDVAVLDDGRLLVADTRNARLSLLEADGRAVRGLAGQPLVSAPSQLAIAQDGRLVAADPAKGRILSWLGAQQGATHDGYLRDYLGDAGVEPSGTVFVASSPDILIRHAPDLDLAALGANGLETVAFQQPRYRRNAYVYLAVHNRGDSPVTGAAVRVFWTDPTGQILYPDDWRADGLFHHWAAPGEATPGNTLALPDIPARANNVDGRVIVGPLIWRAPAPETAAAGDGRFALAARLVHLEDPTTILPTTAAAYVTNNVALRDVEVRRGPFPDGPQDTLVLRAAVPPLVVETDLDIIETRLTDLNDWLALTSYDAVSLAPIYRGPVTLDHPLNYYQSADRSMLIDMAEEVLGKALAADPNVLDGAGTGSGDDIDRVIIVLNDPAFQSDWATTGLWPYTVGNTTRWLSVQVQGPDNAMSQYAHGMLHQFGMKDLLIHEQVDFGGPHTAESWDVMADPLNAVHPLVWSKETPGWVTGHGAQVRFIGRPDPLQPILNAPPITLVPQSQAQQGDIAAIAIGLSSGATTLESEQQFYYVEARQPSDDDPVPAPGAVVYYANDAIPQGEGPVVVTDANDATPTLNDAPLTPGVEIAPSGTGIAIRLAANQPPGDAVAIEVDYAPPVTQFDVYLRQGSPEWTSPDIWIDNQRDGGGYDSYDGTLQVSGSGPQGEPAIADEENRVYTRVFNDGPATAYDVEVRFQMSEPWHTVGGEDAFEERAIRFIAEIPPGEYRDVFFTWVPDGTDDPHNCVRVELRRLTNDYNPNNNDAQQNVNVVASTSASPFKEVEHMFSFRHNDKAPKLVYFRADGIPRNWDSDLSPRQQLIKQRQPFVGKLRLKPDDDAPVCTNENIEVSAWSPRGDTIVRIGGTTVSVALRKQTNMKFDVGTRACKLLREGNAYFTRPGNRRVRVQPNGRLKECQFIVASGCIEQIGDNDEVSLRFMDPDGNPIYRTVKTDRSNCFRGGITAVDGGDWRVSAIYQGDKCMGPAKDEVPITLDIAAREDADLDGLIDREEVQGDADGDGIPNHLDRDSDNDGVIDKDEASGDADQDGLANIIDPDSDNDGVIDGNDTEPYTPKK
ncbi:MAG: hypothetical protein AB8B82_06930 [Roseovarius sp.]